MTPLSFRLSKTAAPCDTNSINTARGVGQTISKAKTQTWHRILTHYLPLYFPEIAHFAGNSRSDWFFALIERFPTPASITALDAETFSAAAWPLIGRKVSEARLINDIYETACASRHGDRCSQFRPLSRPRGREDGAGESRILLPTFHGDRRRPLRLAPVRTEGSASPALGDADHDVMLALIRWIKQGNAPEAIVASSFSSDGSYIAQRPWCAYPAVARWDRKRDRTKAQSYICPAS